MKKTTILAAAFAMLPAFASAAPVAESLKYRAYIGGLALGDLQLKIAMDDTGYATAAQFDMGRLLRIFLDTDARASSTGALRNGEAVPQSFDYWVRDGEKQRNTEMSFDAEGNPSGVDADPGFDKRDYDVTLDQVRGAIDPASAVAMLSAERAAPCAVDMTIFDGRKLHRITMKPASTPETPHCIGKYERLGGFKAKYMTPKRRTYPFEAKLEQIAPSRWRPVRIWAETKFGRGVAVLK